MDPIRLLVSLACPLALCIGCGSTAPLPVPNIVAVPEFVALGKEVSPFTTVAVDPQYGKMTYHWRVSKDGVQLKEAFGTFFSYTPELLGTYSVTLSCKQGWRVSPPAVATMVAEPGVKHDQRLTIAMAGVWRYTTEEAVVFLSLHRGGKANMRAQLLAGGAGDAMASAAQHDMGEFKGEWWVSNGDLILKPGGVENPLWNIWVRAVDAVTAGEIGKAEVCGMNFLGDTMIVDIDGDVRTLVRVLQ